MHLNCVITVVDRNNADFVNTMYEEVEIPLILTMLGSDPHADELKKRRSLSASPIPTRRAS